MSNLVPPNPIDIALHHHQAGRLAEAETLYRQVQAAQPNHANALHLLGVLCGQTKRVAAAIDLLSRACAVSPPCRRSMDPTRRTVSPGGPARQGRRDITTGYSNRADIGPGAQQPRQRAGRPTQTPQAAAECYRTAARLDPRMDRAFSNLGVVLKELGDPAQAIAAFNGAIAINPNSAIAYDNLGLALRDTGQVDAAMAAHSRALQLDPNSSSTFDNISIVLRVAGRYDESIAASHKAISLNPASADAYNNLGVTRAERGRVDEAIAAYRKSLTITARLARRPGPTWAMPLGCDKGEFAEGLAACQRAVDINPASPGATTSTLA